VLLIFFAVHIQSVYGYIDPGTGSMVVQILIGTFIGFGIAIKVYWYKLKEKFMRKK
jgi:hypothetical protein